MLKISESCFKDAVLFFPNIVSGIVGVGLSRIWVRSAAHVILNLLGKFLEMGGFMGKNPWRW